MVKWVLILAIGSGNDHGYPTALTNVQGFESYRECEVAGIQAQKALDTRFVCVQKTNANEGK